MVVPFFYFLTTDLLILSQATGLAVTDTQPIRKALQRRLIFHTFVAKITNNNDYRNRKY
jgi:hypothetical protein